MQSLRQLTGATESSRVRLASRSLTLVQAASRRLFRVARHVLTTDLSWPTYQRVVEDRAARIGRRVKTVLIRESILRNNWTTADVADYLARAFLAEHCDALFLPAVDHLGIRVPVGEVVRRIRRRAELRFCLIDAAQALAHVPLEDSLAYADVLIAGSHKWLGAYLPLGIGFWRGDELPESRIGDPLGRFTAALDGNHLDGFSETANVTPLLACAGAVTDRLAERNSKPFRGVGTDEWLGSLPQPPEAWRPMQPCVAMRSRITLLTSPSLQYQQLSADALRRLWLDAGVIVSAYDGGMVRLSMPVTPPHTAAAAQTERLAAELHR